MASCKNLHGTQGIALQCMRTYNMIQAFPTCELFPAGSQREELRFVKEVVRNRRNEIAEINQSTKRNR